MCVLKNASLPHGHVVDENLRAEEPPLLGLAQPVEQVATLQAQQREVTRLRGELGAAYRASAIAAWCLR